MKKCAIISLAMLLSGIPAQADPTAYAVCKPCSRMIAGEGTCAANPDGRKYDASVPGVHTYNGTESPRRQGSRRISVVAGVFFAPDPG